jgi:hypothetical protein
MLKLVIRLSTLYRTFLGPLLGPANNGLAPRYTVISTKFRRVVAGT